MKDYKSELSAAIHELHKHGVIDKTTMREFDESCLSPVESLPPEGIRAGREHADIS